MPLYVALHRPFNLAVDSDLVQRLCLLFSFIFIFSFVNFFTLNCDNYNLQPVTYSLLNFVSFSHLEVKLDMSVTSIFGYTVAK